MVVSGAGPTLVALTLANRTVAVARALVEGYRRAGLEATAHEATVDARGARVESA